MEKKSAQDELNFKNARINNNYQFQRAKYDTFSNLQSFSKTAVYALNQGCSIEQARHNMIENLLANFQKTKSESAQNQTKIFQKLIQSRIGGQEDQNMSDEDVFGSDDEDEGEDENSGSDY